jgi:hypothetical protein
MTLKDRIESIIMESMDLYPVYHLFKLNSYPKWILKPDVSPADIINKIMEEVEGEEDGV